MILEPYKKNVEKNPRKKHEKVFIFSIESPDNPRMFQLFHNRRKKNQNCSKPNPRNNSRKNTTYKFLKMEARMLKITKIVRTTTTAPNNSLIGRNIRNTYQPEILKQTVQKNYFANNKG